MLIFRLGSDADRLFSFELMQEHLLKFAKFGLFSATVLLPIVTLDSTNGFNSDEIANKKDEEKKDSKITYEILPETQISDKSLKEINKRLHEVVIDMERLGYI